MASPRIIVDDAHEVVTFILEPGTLRGQLMVLLRQEDGRRYLEVCGLGEIQIEPRAANLVRVVLKP